MRVLDAAGVRHAGGGETIKVATRPCAVSAAGQTLASSRFCSALPPGFNATAERPLIGAIRVRQSLEFDSTFFDEAAGTPPFVHSGAHKRTCGQHNNFVAVALRWGAVLLFARQAVARRVRRTGRGSPGSEAAGTVSSTVDVLHVRAAARRRGEVLCRQGARGRAARLVTRPGGLVVVLAVIGYPSADRMPRGKRGSP